MNSAEALATGQDVTVKQDGSCELAGVSLPGLPEGILAVGYHEPKKDDLVLYGGMIKTVVAKTFGPQLVVKLAPGYDITYDITRDENRVMRTFDAPKEISVNFLVKNSAEEAAVFGLEAHPSFAGFATSSRS